MRVTSVMKAAYLTNAGCRLPKRSPKAERSLGTIQLETGSRSRASLISSIAEHLRGRTSIRALATNLHLNPGKTHEPSECLFCPVVVQFRPVGECGAHQPRRTPPRP